MSGPAEATLFDGAHLRAVLFNPDARRLIVTFDFRKLGKSDFQDSAPSRNFARRGFAQLSIRSRANDWFVNPETLALESALHGLGPRYERVGLLGYSMGGYGAFRFASALGAASVVAISPQYSIHPDVVPFDRRYRVESRDFDPQVGDLAPRASASLRGFMLVDPFMRLDLANATMLQRVFPNVQLARVGFGGHPAMKVLKATRRAWLLHHAAMQADPDPVPVLEAHRVSRRRSSVYWDRLAALSEARRPALASAARARAAGLPPPRPDAQDESAEGDAEGDGEGDA